MMLTHAEFLLVAQQMTIEGDFYFVLKKIRGGGLTIFNLLLILLFGKQIYLVFFVCVVEISVLHCSGI